MNLAADQRHWRTRIQDAIHALEVVTEEMEQDRVAGPAVLSTVAALSFAREAADTLNTTKESAA